MNIVKLCGSAILILAALITLKNCREGLAFLGRVSSVLFFAAVLISTLTPVSELIRGLMRDSGMSGYGEVILKSLGVIYLSHFTADICRECGENGIAQGVESIGRAELLLIALPLVREVAAMARGLASW